MKFRMEDRKASRLAREAEKKAERKSQKESSKRKSTFALDGNEERPKSHKNKKHRTSNDESRATINMNLPDLTNPNLLPASMRVQSEAVKSLFVKKDKDGKPIEAHTNNFLVRGTFNRFAASF